MNNPNQLQPEENLLFQTEGGCSTFFKGNIGINLSLASSIPKSLTLKLKIFHISDQLSAAYTLQHQRDDLDIIIK